jgi:hypothetical protein
MFDEETRRSHHKAIFEADFVPNTDPHRHPCPEERLAAAAEYAAYHWVKSTKTDHSHCSNRRSARRILRV